MLVLVSPAKKLDFETEVAINGQTDTKFTEPQFKNKTKSLATHLKKLTANDIKKLMKLSDNLSALNHERFKDFQTKNAPLKPAVFAFNGDTYTGLDISSFDKNQLKVAQQKLRILSGLYGVLRPLDLIHPYRLEMGTKFSTPDSKNLYEYWTEEITNFLNDNLKKEKILVNCASGEYFKAVDTKKIQGQIITPIFKELRNGQYKIISFSAKKARGMMANYIIKNNITNPNDIKKFTKDQYKFSEKLSNPNEFVFVR